MEDLWRRLMVGLSILVGSGGLVDMIGFSD